MKHLLYYVVVISLWVVENHLLQAEHIQRTRSTFYANIPHRAAYVCAVFRLVPFFLYFEKVDEALLCVCVGISFMNFFQKKILGNVK